MLAVLGGARSGKSMLLSVLAGATVPSQGCVLSRGAPLHERESGGGPTVGYCPQSNIHLDSLTVLEQVRAPLEHVDDERARDTEPFTRHLR